MLKTVFAQDSAEGAQAHWRQVADALRERLPELAKLMDGTREDVLAYMTSQREHWRQIASTNPLERPSNGAIKRRADVASSRTPPLWSGWSARSGWSRTTSGRWPAAT